MKVCSKGMAKKIFFIAFTASVFIAALAGASSEERVKYSEMEKENIGGDAESQESLKEYYGDVLGSVKTEAKFNTLATKNEIAVLNVTIDGKDRRILTRLYSGNASTTQQNLSYARLITAENLVVLGNISLKGILFSEIESSFGSRRLLDIKSTALRYNDEGFSRLVNGKANVSINPILRELISSYKVFLSAEGLTKGIYVAEKTNSYFIVKSANSNSNVGFSWMLSGASREFSGLGLSSEYAKARGIEITAEINFENGTTEVRINGLNKIFALANKTPNNSSNNPNKNNNTRDNNSNSSQGIVLVTGNLIDEFGLETDLGRILGNATPLPDLNGSENNNQTSNEATNNSDNLINENNNSISNESAPIGLGGNSSAIPKGDELAFILYSTDEELIASQISEVTGLSVLQAKKLINFAYLEPQNFEDETIEDTATKLGFIEKINGSVVIRLG